MVEPHYRLHHDVSQQAPTHGTAAS
jgi:hypothetical protein